MDIAIRCICPPKADGEPRHEGDTITLRDTLGFVATQTARNAIHLARSEAAEQGTNLDAAYALALLTEQYLVLGIEAWTLVDEKGKAIPVNRATIRAFLEGEADDVVSFVSDEADGIYARKVMLPLLATAATSSQPTPTAGSTSPTRGSGRARKARSSPSSITSIPTAGTATTSRRRAGGSSSSQSSASVA